MVFPTLLPVVSLALATLTLVTAATHRNAAPRDAACDSLIAGEAAQKACEALKATFKSASGLVLKDPFAYYYVEGSNPSLEELAAGYAKGVVPADVKVGPILDSLRPDYNAKGDFGYGKSNGRAAQNGAEGGLPAFCRFGGSIVTSPLTSVLAEVWLPLASDPSLPLFVSKTQNDPKTADKPAADGKPSTEKPLVANKPKEKPTDADKQQEKTDTLEKQPEPPATKQSAASVQQPMGQPQRRSHRVLAGDEVLGTCPGWNGRLLQHNNGGQRGWVPYSGMKQTMARYKFALAGSNFGHFSDTGAVEWIAGPDREEILKDFGRRATEVTQAFAHEVIDTFYGAKAGVRSGADKGNRVLSYLAGASVGGGLALSTAQNNPTLFDGIMASAPTIDFNGLNAGQIHTQSVGNKNFSGDGWFDKEILAGPGHQVILSQCDELDGVKDGVISLPRLCKPRFENDMLCGKDGAKYGGSNETCLTQAQINNLNRLYEPTILEGEEVYPAYFPGIEQNLASFSGEAKKAIGFFQIAVIGQEERDVNFDGFRDITLATVKKGWNEQLAAINAKNPDISAFINSGGVLLHAHGGADITVATARSSQYYEEVLRAVDGKLRGKQVSDAYRYFEILGMGHSRGGVGAWHSGLVTQIGYGNRPLKYDTKHDMLLALVAWKEQGIAPDFQVGATYTNDTYEHLENTRRICPYPSYATYLGGSTKGEDAWQNFACKSASSINVSVHASFGASISIGGR